MKNQLTLPLIILIAIFAVVAAVFFRAVVAQDHPRPTACLSNVKQLTTGMIMYAQDHDDRLPLTDRWMDVATSALMDNQERDFYCPFLKNRKPDEYGYSMYFKMAGREVGSITNPADIVLVFDSVVLDKNAATGLVGFGDRHEAAPFGFADGHAKHYGPKNKTERDKIVAVNLALK